MLEFTKDNFEAEVLQSDLPVLVDFWGPSCTKCLAMMPQVEALAEKYAGKMKFGKVNVAENRRLAVAQRVLGLPAVLFFNAGEKVASLAGEVTKAKIEAEIAKLT